ncbi:hypothetical protein C8Q74DRAFT_525917 [Fomes fomentarius]|nr:hypothetical protein C8Q74DRAFT_525917 [Fomes fomentarius]
MMTMQARTTETIRARGQSHLLLHVLSPLAPLYPRYCPFQALNHEIGPRKVLWSKWYLSRCGASIACTSTMHPLHILHSPRLQCSFPPTFSRPIEGPPRFCDHLPLMRIAHICARVSAALSKRSAHVATPTHTTTTHHRRRASSTRYAHAAQQTPTHRPQYELQELLKRSCQPTTQPSQHAPSRQASTSATTVSESRGALRISDPGGGWDEYTVTAGVPLHCCGPWIQNRKFGLETEGE